MKMRGILILITIIVLIIVTVLFIQKKFTNETNLSPKDRPLSDKSPNFPEKFPSCECGFSAIPAGTNLTGLPTVVTDNCHGQSQAQCLNTKCKIQYTSPQTGKNRIDSPCEWA